MLINVIFVIEHVNPVTLSVSKMEQNLENCVKSCNGTCELVDDIITCIPHRVENESTLAIVYGVIAAILVLGVVASLLYCYRGSLCKHHYEKKCQIDQYNKILGNAVGFQVLPLISHQTPNVSKELRNVIH